MPITYFPHQCPRIYRLPVEMPLCDTRSGVCCYTLAVAISRFARTCLPYSKSFNCIHLHDIGGANLRNVTGGGGHLRIG